MSIGDARPYFSEAAMDEIRLEAELNRASRNQAWTRFAMETQPDGSLTGWATTNDNLDLGHASQFAEWPTHAPNLRELTKRARAFGATVTVDGRELNTQTGVLVERRVGPANRRRPFGGRRP